MMNNIGKNLKDSIASEINSYLNYVDGSKINLIANYLELTINDKYDYGSTLDEILYYCCNSLANCNKVLLFIDNNYQSNEA